ncbi:MAG: divalent-cation tolerance protein CutA [Leptolyngbya sp. SIO4C5]|nr:divalent-cation tolerance protein CutA [Leptolyngbya sp. SIO4C5]
MTQFGVVLVTASSETEANTIASALVQERLAACVSLVPIQSVYRWQGEVQQETEWQLMIKTDLAQFTTLAERVQQLHSYEVPEIIALPIVAGTETYLNWVAAETAQP